MFGGASGGGSGGYADGGEGENEVANLVVGTSTPNYALLQTLQPPYLSQSQQRERERDKDRDRERERASKQLFLSAAMVELTAAATINGFVVEKMASHISIILVKESFKLKEEFGDVSSYMHLLLREGEGMARAHAFSLACNAVLCFKIDILILKQETDNSVYAVILVSGDAVSIVPSNFGISGAALDALYPQNVLYQKWFEDETSSSSLASTSSTSSAVSASTSPVTSSFQNMSSSDLASSGNQNSS